MLRQAGPKSDSTQMKYSPYAVRQSIAQTFFLGISNSAAGSGKENSKAEPHIAPTTAPDAPLPGSSSSAQLTARNLKLLKSMKSVERTVGWIDNADNHEHRPGKKPGTVEQNSGDVTLGL